MIEASVIRENFAVAILAGCFYLFVMAMCFRRPRAKVKELLDIDSGVSRVYAADVLRGLAALWVALFHMISWSPAFSSVGEAHPWLAQGEKAVPVFVTLSGFLIYRACRFTELSSIRRYIIMRIIRLYPVYIAVTIATFCIMLFVFTDDTIKNQVSSFDYMRISQYFLSQILMLNVIGVNILVVPQFWSLYVEVIFYIMIPIWVVFFHSMMSTRRGMFVYISMLIGMILVLYVAPFSGPRNVQLWVYFPLGMIASHGYNMLASIESSAKKSVVSIILTVIGCVLIFVDLSYAGVGLGHTVCLPRGGAAFSDPRMAFLNQYFGPGVAASCVSAVWLNVTSNTIWTGVAAALFLAACDHLDSVRWLCSRFPFQILAAVSYSIFGWHSVVMVLVNVYPNGTGGVISAIFIPQINHELFLFVFLVPALLTVAGASYILIERPALLLKRKFR